MDDRNRHIDEHVRRAAPARESLLAELTDPEVKDAFLRRILLDVQPAAPTAPPVRIRHRWAFVAATVLALVVVGGALVGRSVGGVAPPEGADGTTTTANAAAPLDHSATTDPTATSRVDGGLASCAVNGRPEEVARDSDVAFDGTVVAIAPSPVQWMGLPTVEVTFAVGRWFRGPGGHFFTVRMLSPENRNEGILFYWGYLPYDLGARILVSGWDSGTEFHATGCGMTSHYRAERAADWARAFAATPSPSPR